MCARGTPARVRLSCQCSQVISAGAAVVIVSAVLFVLTRLVLMLAVAGVWAVGTLVIVRLMQRFSIPGGVRRYNRSVRAAPRVPVMASGRPAAEWRVVSVEKVPDRGSDRLPAGMAPVRVMKGARDG